MDPYRVELREKAAAALLAAATDAGTSVFTPRALPMPNVSLPTINVQVPIDRGDSNGRSAPSFTRVAYLVAIGKVSGTNSYEVEDKLDRLGGQIEYALMLSADLQVLIQQVTEIDIRQDIDATKDRIYGAVTVRLGLEYTETFPPPGTPLIEIDGTMQANGNPDFADMAVKFPSN